MLSGLLGTMTWTIETASGYQRSNERIAVSNQVTQRGKRLVALESSG